MSVRGEWRGDVIKGQVRRIIGDTLLESAHQVKDAAVQVAPKLTSELRESAYADVGRSTLIAIVGFDVPRDIKTIKQHEDLTYRHPAGEQAKFLEEPLRAANAKVGSTVAANLRRYMG